MKVILLVLASILAISISAVSQAETVLHISVQAPMEQDTPITTQVHVEWVLERTGQEALSGIYNPTLTLKNGLGLYKTPSALNVDLQNEVLDYMDTSYSVTTINAVYLQGGFTGLIL